MTTPRRHDAEPGDQAVAEAIRPALQEGRVGVRSGPVVRSFSVTRRASRRR